MSTTKAELIDLYRRRAGNYDFTANLYYLIGYREWAFRKKAVEALALGCRGRFLRSLNSRTEARALVLSRSERSL